MKKLREVNDIITRKSILEEFSAWCERENLDVGHYPSRSHDTMTETVTRYLASLDHEKRLGRGEEIEEK